jgi:large subunit ribosomal protein L13
VQSVALSNSSASGHGSGMAMSSSSSFMGRGLSVAKRVQVAQRPASSQSGGLRCSQGNFIPAEHRFLYEGIEKKGPDVWDRTYYPKASDHVNLEKQWYIVDAADKRLGRLASAVAVHIRGKNLATFTPSIDMGAYVVVINAEKVGVTGKKSSQKLYRRRLFTHLKVYSGSEHPHVAQKPLPLPIVDPRIGMTA